MLTQLLIYSISLGAGLLVTLVLGGFCNRFLKRTVRVNFPERFRFFQAVENTGVGSQLGTIERLIFFMSFWLEQYYLALGWLIFKLGAKWASWQHVVKIPEGTRDDDACLRDRLFLAARLLGRFLNGTAYNIFCAGIGGSLAMFVRYYYYPLFAFFPTYWLAIVGAILNVVALLVMFCALWCKPRTAEDTVEAP